jgi:hypothetical protein
MSLYGMDANINQTDGLQQAFANRIASISDRNQDILSKWQEGQKTKIEEDTVKQYGDQAIGVGETVEQLAGAGATAKNYLAKKKQMVEDKIEQGNRRRRNRKRRIRRQAGEDGVSTDEDEGEIERDSAGNEIQKPRVNKPVNSRTDDPEADGEAQHNTGGAPESPEEISTDTHEGEISGGQDDQPEAVQSEAPTDNGETSAPTEEPAPAPAPTPEPTEEPDLGNQGDDAQPVSAPEPVETPEPVSVGETTTSAVDDIGGDAEAEGISLYNPSRTAQYSNYGGVFDDEGVRSGISRARGRLDFLNNMPDDPIDVHLSQQTSEGITSKLGRLGSSAREAVGTAVSRARTGFDPVASLEQQRANLASAQSARAEELTQRISMGDINVPTQQADEAVASATETAERVAGETGDAVASATETGSSLLDRGSAFVGRVGRGISSATDTVGQVASQLGEGDIEGATQTTAGALGDVAEAGEKVGGIGGKVAQGATKLAGGVLKYGGAVAGAASFGEGLYGEIEAGGKEGDDTTQRVANWASTISSGLETVGAGLDLSGVGVEAGVALNIAGAVVGAGATIVDDIDKWFEDKKQKEADQNKLKTQRAQGLEGVQGNPTYQNVGGSGEVAGVSQSAVRVS